MISGTSAIIDVPQMIPWAALGCRGASRIASVDEIRELMEQCEEGTAMCVSCEDGMAVLELRVVGEALELFVKLAIAFRHGAFERQERELLKIARDLEAETVAFQTRRAGWARRLGPEWQRRGTMEFFRSVR